MDNTIYQVNSLEKEELLTVMKNNKLIPEDRASDTYLFNYTYVGNEPKSVAIYDLKTDVKIFYVGMAIFTPEQLDEEGKLTIL
jgi:hypothetical protein